MENNIQKEKMLKNFFLQTKSPAYRKVIEDCERVARSNVNVLIIGASGTGKEVAAKYIHACSARCNKPIITINCSAYTETLLESELFGHEQGAFTGALRSRVGRFELADQGTLFLDEIGDISLSTQIKLLRAIETKTIERIGSNQQHQIEFRLITATNQDFQRQLQEEKFREDFFYRISTIVIRIPSLSERREDLEDLVQYFLLQSQKENDRHINHIEPEVWQFLMAYDYPGNIRELKNIIDRMVVLSQNGIITMAEMPVLYNMNQQPFAIERGNQEIIPWRAFKAKSEREYLLQVLKKTNFNVEQTAKKLEITPRQVFNKIKEYHLKGEQKK